MAEPGASNGAVAASDLMPRVPDLGQHLPRVADRLAQRGQLGVLTVVVLEHDKNDSHAGWSEFDSIHKEILPFLDKYARRRMRREDLLLDSITSGNTLVLFLDPPRTHRMLDLSDVTLVRQRLERSLHSHLSRHLPRATTERFGVYVGGELLRHDTTVESRRIICLSLESAFADAITQRKVESRRHQVHLERILDTERLATVYQPVVNMMERRVIGLEALMRVPVALFRSPDLLLKAAYEGGALWRLERLARRRALQSLPELENGQRLFLSVEPDSLEDPELRSSAFLRQLGEAGLRPDQVVLEVTQHVAVKGFAALRRTLAAFQSLGFQMAMDHIGSGYASLQAIAEIDLDYLKVDMNLVRDLHRHPIRRELIATIRRFADSTGITLIAEGVEKSEEMVSLAEAGVRCAQGNLFASPQARPKCPDWERLARVGTPTHESVGS